MALQLGGASGWVAKPLVTPAFVPILPSRNAASYEVSIGYLSTMAQSAAAKRHWVFVALCARSSEAPRAPSSVHPRKLLESDREERPFFSEIWMARRFRNHGTY